MQTVKQRVKTIASQMTVEVPYYLNGEILRAAVNFLNDPPSSTRPTMSPRMMFTGERLDLLKRKVIPFGTFAVARGEETGNIVMVLGPSPLSYNSVACLQLRNRIIVHRSDVQVLKYLPELPKESGLKYKYGGKRKLSSIAVNFRPKHKNSPTDNWNAHYASAQLMINNYLSDLSDEESLPESGDLEAYPEEEALPEKEALPRRYRLEALPAGDNSGTTSDTNIGTEESEVPPLHERNTASAEIHSETDTPREGELSEGDESIYSEASDSENELSEVDTRRKYATKRKVSASMLNEREKRIADRNSPSRRKRTKLLREQQEAKSTHLPERLTSLTQAVEKIPRGKGFPRSKGRRTPEAKPRYKLRRMARKALEAGELPQPTVETSKSDNDSGYESISDIRVSSLDTGKEYVYPIHSRYGRLRKPSKKIEERVYLLKCKDREGKVYRISVKAALKSDRAQETIEAIRNEIINMLNYQVGHYVRWKDIPNHKRKNIIMSFMFIKHKELPDGRYDKTKARLVINGAKQKEHLYDLTHSSTVALTSVFLLMNIATYHKSYMATFDIKGAFLHAKFTPEDEPIYIKIPREIANIWVEMDEFAKEFQDETTGDLLMLLEKFLYGLKQSPRKFQLVLTQVLEDLGYKRMTQDNCLYAKHDGGDFSILSTHVDDIMQVFTDMKFYQELVEGLTKAFGGVEGLTSSPQATSYIGMTIERSPCMEYIRLSQRGQIDGAIEMFDLESDNMSDGERESNRVQYRTPCDDTLFEPAVGEQATLLSTTGQTKFLSLLMKLMYIARLTRPDTLMPITYLSTRSNKATIKDFLSLRRVIRYLDNTRGLGIVIHCKEKWFWRTVKVQY